LIVSSRIVPAVPPPEACSPPAPLTESTIRHVRQRSLRDCGVAAAAMLAAVSYERAARAHPPARRGGGLQAMDIAVMLRRLTGRFVRLSGAAEGDTLAEYAAAAAGPAIVLIHEPDSVRGHYVVVADGLVLDPELAEPAPMASYRHREWCVFRVLTLEDAPVASAA
jgi:hypothetical protein